MGGQAEPGLAVLGVQNGAGVVVKVELVALKRGREGGGVRIGSWSGASLLEVRKKG